MKKGFIYLLVALMSVGNLTAIAQAPRKTAPRPNFIIIFMDDMGYGDPECYNGAVYHTPHINKLAAEGMRFTNFYAAQAVCTASRAGILTGCYPNRLGIHGAFMPWTEIALNPRETTIASMLKKEGYYTGMIGKWHLGAKAPYFPIHYGFDEYLGLPYSNDMWPVGYDGKPVTDTANRMSKYPPLPLLEGDQPVRYIKTLDDQGTLTATYTQRACDFIKKNKNRPFFLYLAHSMVHVPIAASPRFLGKSGAGLFGDVMMEVDWSVGEIMQTLKQQGIDKNTMVVFTSDNGPWLTFGDHAGNAGGLREGKGSSWEGGQREPCIIRWPGIIPAGTICNNLSATIDLLPTIAKLAHAPLPENKIDGVDISSLLFMEKGANPRNEFAYYYRRNNLEAVRKGSWKLVLPHRGQTYKTYMPGKNGFPGGYAEADEPMALYDLAHDPGETLDVQKSYPDIVKDLMTVVEKYRSTLGDDLTQTPCKECREAAKITVKK
ncbi:sulfatase [Chitinophaga sp. 212800008-4]|uniref:sulfatase family protein n=1 Tax=unclassified Chitinophaga TaxID=2619133 RepID=UPI0030D2BAFF